MGKTGKILNLILPILSILLIAVLWTVSAVVVGDGLILPSLSETFGALVGLIKSEGFYTAFFSTMIRSVVAFSISFALAFIAALVSYKYIYAKKFLAPIITIVRTLPTIAVVLLLVVWTNSKIAPVIVTTLVVFPTMYGELSVAFGGIDKDALEMCKVFNVGKKDRFFKVVLPQTAPYFIAAAGSGLTLNIKLMVAAEVLASTARSMGYLLNTSKIYFETATMMALILFTLVVGLIIEGAFSLLSKKAGRFL